MLALRQIRECQRHEGLVILCAPFRRVVREIAQGEMDDMRFQPSAIDGLQEAAEGFLMQYFECESSPMSDVYDF